jgi:hypothetical protein
MIHTYRPAAAAASVADSGQVTLCGMRPGLRQPWRSADVFAAAGNRLVELHRYDDSAALRTPNGVAHLTAAQARALARTLLAAAEAMEIEIAAAELPP